MDKLVIQYMIKILIDDVDSSQEKWQKWGEEMAIGDGFSPIKRDNRRQ